MQVLAILASLGIGTALLPIWRATDARSAETSRPVAKSSVDGSFVE